MTAAWVGVDPGGRATGIVVRDGTDLIWWAVITRDDHDRGGSLGVGPGYLSAVAAAIGTARRSGDHLLPVAVEGVVAPTPHMNGKLRITDPGPTIAAGIVLGAVLVQHLDAVVVAPNRHGGGWLGGYPAALVTATERRAGLDRPAGHSALTNHARSAWDVAGAGPNTRRAHLVATRRTR